MAGMVRLVNMPACQSFYQQKVKVVTMEELVEMAKRSFVLQAFNKFYGEETGYVLFIICGVYAFLAVPIWIGAGLQSWWAWLYSMFIFITLTVLWLWVAKTKVVAIIIAFLLSLMWGIAGWVLTVRSNNAIPPAFLDFLRNAMPPAVLASILFFHAAALTILPLAMYRPKKKKHQQREMYQVDLQ